MKNDRKPVAQNYVYKDNPDKKFTKKCHYCKQVIDKKASICPYCKMKQPLGCLAAIIILLVLAAIMGIFLFLMTQYT